MRVLLHTGKGGVGKTTLALASAFGAAEHGHRVFVLSTDAAHSLSDAVGQRIGPRPVAVTPHVTLQELAVLDEIDRAWSEIQRWLRALMRDETDEMVADELLVFPGLEELISLRAIREIEATGDYDVCVVDCAPTGSTLRMLRFPDALQIFMTHFFDLERRGARLLRPIVNRLGRGDWLPDESFFEAFERLVRDIEDVRQILLDADRTSARLVVNPARVVVDEARRSFAYLSLYGVATDAVLINRVLPDEARGGYFARWGDREHELMNEIDASFPIPRLRAPLRPREPIGVEALGALARDLFGERDPASHFTHERPIRLRKRAGRTLLEIALPGVSKEEVGARVGGDELYLTVRDAHRRVALPASVAGREIAGLRLHGGVLEIEFAS